MDTSAHIRIDKISVTISELYDVKTKLSAKITDVLNILVIVRQCNYNFQFSIFLSASTSADI